QSASCASMRAICSRSVRRAARSPDLVTSPSVRSCAYGSMRTTTPPSLARLLARLDRDALAELRGHWTQGSDPSVQNQTQGSDPSVRVPRKPQGSAGGVRGPGGLDGRPERLLDVDVRDAADLEA